MPFTHILFFLIRQQVMLYKENQISTIFLIPMPLQNVEYNLVIDRKFLRVAHLQNRKKNTALPGNMLEVDRKVKHLF